MIKFDLAERFIFHDSTLNNIINCKDNIILSLENVDVNGVEHSIKISIKDVGQISENNVLINYIDMQAEYGSIFDFQEKDSGILLCIEWRKHSPTWSKFCAYILKGANIAAEVYDSKPTE